MLHPSYSDLMNVVNSEVEQGEAPVVNSRYSIVMATSKRAREIIDGDEPMVKSEGKKALSIADRAYVLETGNIVLSGDAKDLMNDESVKKAYLSE